MPFCLLFPPPPSAGFSGVLLGTVLGFFSGVYLLTVLLDRIALYYKRERARHDMVLVTRDGDGNVKWWCLLVL